MEFKEIKSNKKKYIDLLLLADEQESMIDKYIDSGNMFVLIDNEIVVAECVVTNNSKGVYEIKNIAVLPQKQKYGYGRMLIDFIFEHYKDCNTLYAGTGESNMTIPFYKACGFSKSHRIKNFFTDNYDHYIYEDGKKLVDMIYFKKVKNLNSCKN